LMRTYKTKRIKGKIRISLKKQNKVKLTRYNNKEIKNFIKCKALLGAIGKTLIN